MNEFEEVQKLIRLKRFEQPPEDYFENFVGEFHNRQRAELLNRSARGLFMERVGTYFSGFGKSKWFYAAGGAYAAAMLVFFLVPRSGQPGAGQGSSGLTKVSSLMDDSNFNLVDDAQIPTLDELDAIRVIRDGRASAADRITRPAQSLPEPQEPLLFDKDVRIIEF